MKDIEKFNEELDDLIYYVENFDISKNEYKIFNKKRQELIKMYMED